MDAARLDRCSLTSANAGLRIESSEDFGGGEDLESAGSLIGTGEVCDAVGSGDMIIGYNLTDGLNRMSGDEIVGARVEIGFHAIAECKPTLHAGIMAYSERGYASSERGDEAGGNATVGIGEYGFRTDFVL